MQHVVLWNVLTVQAVEGASRGLDLYSSHNPFCTVFIPALIVQTLAVIFPSH